MISNEELNVEELRSLGLNPHEIILHQTRILQSLSHQVKSSIAIHDTCRIDNGGILPQVFLSKDLWPDPSGYVSFTPSAGAATRYFKSLNPFLASIETNDTEQVEIELKHLKLKGLAGWCLPPIVKDSMLKSARVCLEKADDIRKALQKPKAVQPCRHDNTSYLNAKHQENASIEGIAGEVYIVPPGKAEKFAANLHIESVPKEGAPLFLEQGPKLSTIRFHLNGSPFRNEHEQLSPVPAGHGTLAKLIPDVKKYFPPCHSLFIRNIDNIMGTNESTLQATRAFLAQHQLVLGVIKNIRAALKESNLAKANKMAKHLREQICVPPPAEPYEFIEQQSSEVRELWRLQIEVFQCYPETVSNYFSIENSLELLRKLYQRPVNTLGQVPNSGKDIGGTPVVINTKHGRTTLCLEVPHASAEDKEKFLANPQKATHFNPVFVAAELIDDENVYMETQSPFWILARKHLGDHDVIYHETVLYELLGNGLLANTLFPEIPRSLFHPHKSVEDTIR